MPESRIAAQSAPLSDLSAHEVAEQLRGAIRTSINCRLAMALASHAQWLQLADEVEALEMRFALLLAELVARASRCTICGATLLRSDALVCDSCQERAAIHACETEESPRVDLEQWTREALAPYERVVQDVLIQMKRGGGPR
jgi:hypothetical protein